MSPLSFPLLHLAATAFVDVAVGCDCGCACCDFEAPEIGVVADVTGGWLSTMRGRTSLQAARPRLHHWWLPDDIQPRAGMKDSSIQSLYILVNKDKGQERTKVKCLCSLPSMHKLLTNFMIGQIHVLNFYNQHKAKRTLICTFGKNRPTVSMSRVQGVWTMEQNLFHF